MTAARPIPPAQPALIAVAIVIPDDLPDDDAAHLTTMVERLGFTPLRPAQVADHAAVADQHVVCVNDPIRVAQARAAAEAGERVMVAVPISVGRSLTEAAARAELEPRFTGDHHPASIGIFGAFEDAQEQVLALARAGADGLVLEVPLERDVADLLAQIRALVVGAAPHVLDADPTQRSDASPTVFYAAGWTPPDGYFDL